MAIKVAIIGLGIMGRRMLSHMSATTTLNRLFMDPINSLVNRQATGLKIILWIAFKRSYNKADLVYLACPPAVREPYALEAAAAGRRQQSLVRRQY